MVVRLMRKAARFKLREVVSLLQVYCLVEIHRELGQEKPASRFD